MNTDAISEPVKAFAEEFAATISYAATHPLDNARYLMLNETEGNDMANDLGYLQASVRVPFYKVRTMSEGEIEYLSESLEKTLLATEDIELTEETKRYLQKDSPANVLRHELEHASAAPEHMQDAILIDIVFIQDYALMIDAVTWYPTEQLSFKEQATIYSAPSSLSEDDVISAMRCAEESEDQAFIAQIESLIAMKDRHELN